MAHLLELWRCLQGDLHLAGCLLAEAVALIADTAEQAITTGMLNVEVKDGIRTEKGSVIGSERRRRRSLQTFDETKMSKGQEIPIKCIVNALNDIACQNLTGNAAGMHASGMTSGTTDGMIDGTIDGTTSEMTRGDGKTDETANGSVIGEIEIEIAIGAIEIGPRARVDEGTTQTRRKTRTRKKRTLGTRKDQIGRVTTAKETKAGTEIEMIVTDCEKPTNRIGMA